MTRGTLSLLDPSEVRVGNTAEDPVLVQVVGGSSGGGQIGSDVFVLNEVEVKNNIGNPLRVVFSGTQIEFGEAYIAPNQTATVVEYVATAIGSVNRLVFSGDGDGELKLFVNNNLVMRARINVMQPTFAAVLDAAVPSGVIVKAQITCMALGSSTFSLLLTRL